MEPRRTGLRHDTSHCSFRLLSTEYHNIFGAVYTVAVGTESSGTADSTRLTMSDIPTAESIKLLVPPRHDLEDRNLVNLLEASVMGRQVTVAEGIEIGEQLNVFDTTGIVTLAVASVTPSDAPVVKIDDTTDVEFIELEQDDADGTDDKEDNPIATEGTAATTTFSDIGGLHDEIRHVRRMVELPIERPELFDQMDVDPPTGLLLTGPQGTGKTMLAEALSNEIGASFYHFEAAEVTSRYASVGSENLTSVFEQAEPPAIVFIDELDSIATDRDDSNLKSDERLVTTLLTQMDGLDAQKNVFVVGATNRPDALDPALRRGGRFDKEIEIGVPDEEERREIIELNLRGVPTTDDVSIDEIVARTNGFVGADIVALVREAALNAIARVDAGETAEEDLALTHTDVDQALTGVEPSAMREFHIEVPDVTWDDIGGLEEVKRRLIAAVEHPLEYGDVYETYDIDTGHGVLLEGPTGTGKTMLARAAANQSDANFISINGPELFDKYVGETERELRRVFERARANAPTIVLFDEIDAVAPDRGTAGGEPTDRRLTNQLLAELDGVEENGEDVVVVGTTNHADAVNEAVRRSGRLSETIHVGVPDRDARRAIFEVELEGRPLAGDVDLDELAERTAGYVGADISEIARQAAVGVATDVIEEQAAPTDDGGPVPIHQRDLLDALKQVQSSVDRPPTNADPSIGTER